MGEFGEMLVNGSCKNPDGNPIVVHDSEIIDIMQNILKDHNKQGDRSDIIIMWTLTALSKLSIRIGQGSQDANSFDSINNRIKDSLKTFQNHMNVEIQQRACEFLLILQPVWDNERSTIFEPMPFKGDENMLVDAKDRAALDADEGANQLLFGFDSSPAPTTTAPATGGGGGLLDLDLMLGGNDAPSTAQPTSNTGDIMDLLGGGLSTSQPVAQNNTGGDLMGDLLGLSAPV